MDFDQYCNRVINHLDIEHEGPLPYRTSLTEGDKNIIKFYYLMKLGVMECANFLNQRKAVGL